MTAELRQSESRIRGILDTALDAVIAMDADGLIIEWNPRAETMFGWTRSEAIGQKLSETIIPPQYRDAHAQGMRRFLASGKGPLLNRRVEIMALRRDGSEFPVELAISFQKLDGSYRFYAFIADITERKRGEDELRESAERFFKQESALLGLTRSEPADLAAVLRCITETAAQTLEVERVSIWRCSDDRQAIRCVDLYELSADRHSSGVELRADLYPSYFQALATSEVVAADDAHRDPRTREFSDSYLDPLGISSMMDVPIHLFGCLEGVICHEHVGPPRRWMRDEQMFAMSVSNFVSLAYEQWERKRAEGEVRRTNVLITSILENLPHMVSVKDAKDLRFVHFNQSGEYLLGYSRYEMIGKSDYDLFPKEQADFFTAKDREVLRSGRQLDIPEEPIRTRDKGLRILHTKKVPLLDETGQPLYLLAISEDVTEYKQAEEALAASEKHLRTILAAEPECVKILAPDCTLLEMNPAGLAMIEADDLKEVFGKSVCSLVAPEYRDAFVSLNQRVCQGESGELEFEIVGLKGGRRWLELYAVPFRNDRNDIIGSLGIARDITARKHLEEQLRQAQKMEAVGRLAGGIAHDFNNLLTAILGYCEILLNGLAPAEPLRRNAEEINKAGVRAASLIDQLLSFSRKQILRPAVLDLNDVVADMERMLRRLIGEDITLVTVLGQTLGRVKIDRAQFEQVVMNLAVNARDAMSHGGTLTIETANVHVEEADAGLRTIIRPGSYVVLTVSDTGCGMDAETQRHVFEPFFTTKEQGKGTGLGLATVYGIVQQSGGHILVDSAPDQGTVFKIYLPRVEEAIESPRPTKSVVKAPRSYRGTESILLVEDDGTVRELVCEVLQGAGYNVLMARHSEEAFQVSGRHQGLISLLITDVIMPGMNGRQLVERLRPARPDLRVLYISGYTDDAVLRLGTASADFLQKPFTPDDLVRKVREVLDEPRAGHA